MPSEQRPSGLPTVGLAGTPSLRAESGSRCLRSGRWAPTAARNQSATCERGPAGAGDVARLPESRQRRSTPCPSTWGVGAPLPGSHHSPQSKGKQRVRLKEEKRREKS